MARGRATTPRAEARRSHCHAAEMRSKRWRRQWQWWRRRRRRRDCRGCLGARFYEWDDRQRRGITASHHVVHEGGAHTPQAVDGLGYGPVALCRGRVLRTTGLSEWRGPGRRDLVLEALQVSRVAAVVSADGTVTEAASVELQRPGAVAGARRVDRLELTALLIASRRHAGRGQMEH